MEEKIVDARGKLCPEPLILTKRALKELQAGQPLRVILDNKISRDNVVRFLTDNKMPPLCTQEKGIFELHVNKSTEELIKPDVEEYCASDAGKPGSGDHVILISSDTMGKGPQELGAILMKAFVNAIKEVAPLPQKIIFYNSGILLAVEGSTLVEPLQELERSGVEILVCGTCVNYFGKQESVRVGTISNMYTILEALTGAGKIIQP